MKNNATYEELRDSLRKAADTIDALRDPDLDEKTLSDAEKSIEAFKLARRLWDNNGYDAIDPSTGLGLGEQVSYQTLVTDAMTTDQAAILLPKVISSIVREAVEPMLVGTSLYTRIRFQGGTQITFPSASAIVAADIGPTEEYPEREMQFAGQVTANIGKSGVKVRISDEMIRYSQFDVMGMHIRAGGRAMARHKETKIFAQINSAGVTSFDNSGGSSLHGNTSGRDVTGTLNDTFTVDDLFVMYSDVITNGFVPNTLIMHPLGWLVFARDPVLRAFGFANGGPIFQLPQGNPGLDPWNTQGLAAGANNSGLVGQKSTRVDVPNIFPTALTIIVSPFVTYNSGTNKTSIILCDRNELGLLVEDEALMTDSWDDPMRDIRAVKFRERYGLATLSEGRAIAVAKDVATVRGYDFEDKLVWDVSTTPLP
jgi:hypothetical protein